MTESDKCSQCGSALQSGVHGGLCPACLLKCGLQTNTIGYTADAPNARWTPPAIDQLAPLFPELEIIELLGRGGMGAVYKARQKELDRLVALKILPPEIGREESFAQRFAREAQAMARMNHQNIVTIYDFGQRDELYFFLMEYIDGLSLRQVLNSGGVGAKEALAIVPQICDALQYAHDRGIVHRDIKPENILLNQAGQVKIADFGLAKLVGRTGVSPVAASSGSSGRLTGETATGGTPVPPERIMGTPQYMAPEQKSRPGDVDNRADIYSLGVVFYQMLTGELPAGKFEPPSRKVLIDVRLDEIVLRALEKEPSRRYQQVSEVKTQIETIVATGIGIGGGVGVGGTGVPPVAVSSVSSSGTGVPPVGDVHAPGAISQEPRTMRIEGGLEWNEHKLLINKSVPLANIASVIHWIARIAGTLMLILVGVFIIAEGFPPMGKQPAGVQFELVAMVLWLVGFIVGWWRCGLAAIFILLGSLTFHIVERSLLLHGALEIPAFIGLLYACAWWLGRMARHRASAAVSQGQVLGAGQPGPVAPQSPPASPADPRVIESARQAVKAPAIGMIVAAGINIAVLFAVLTYLLVGLGGATGHAQSTPTIPWRAIFPGGALLVGLCFGLVVFFAAIRMMQLRNRGLAIAGAILAMIASPGNIIGLPMGIWALVVLSRREVIEAFAAMRRTAPMKSRALIWAIVCLVLLAVVGAGAILLPYLSRYPSFRRVHTNAAIEPATQSVSGNQWQVELPSGVKVELVGVSENPSDKAPWWRPDGSALKDRPYSSSQGVGYMSGGDYRVVREFAFRLANLPWGAHTKWAAEPATIMQGCDAPLYVDGVTYPQLRAGIAVIPTGDSQPVATVRLGVASGPWRTIISQDARKASTREYDGRSYLFSTVGLRGGGSDVTVSYKASDMDVRIVAFDRSGKLHLPKHSQNQGSDEDLKMWVIFDGLPPENVERFEFQARPYEWWAEFRNVSLTPGHKTHVECRAVDKELPGPATQQAEAPQGDAWRKRFDEVYRLDDKQVLKRVGPPFIPERNDYYRNEYPTQFSVIREAPNYFVFNADRDGKLEKWSYGFGGKDTLERVLKRAVGLGRQDFDGPADLLDLEVPGDWICRKGASHGQLLADLTDILREGLGRDIRFQRKQVERDVVVVSGKFAFTPQPGAHSNTDVHIYAQTLDPTGASGGGSGSLAKFLEEVGSRLNVTIIDQSDPYAGNVGWAYNHDSYYTRMGDRREELTKKALENLARQTGLTFTRKREKANIWALSEVAADTQAGALATAEEFLALVKANRDTQAMRMADPASAVPHQVEEFRRLGADAVKGLSVTAEYADDAAALVVTSPFEMVEHGNKLKVVLHLKLIKARGLWVVSEIDPVEAEASPAKVKTFLDAHTKAATQPALRQRLVGSGDMLEISVLDLFEQGKEAVFKRQVSDVGTIALPLVNEPLKVHGLTQEQVRKAVVDAYAKADMLKNPSVAVMILPPAEKSSGSSAEIKRLEAKLHELERQLFTYMAMRGMSDKHPTVVEHRKRIALARQWLAQAKARAATQPATQP